MNGYKSLPLHLCAQSGRLKSLVALLEAGADTEAVLFENDRPLRLQNFADKNADTSSEVMNIVRAFEARRQANALMEEILTNAPRPSA